MHKLRQLLGLDDKAFYKSLFALSVPLVIQQGLSALLFLVDTIMVGQLDGNAIAAVGLANEIVFIMQMLAFGLLSGAGVFVAQYWGQKDSQSIKRMLGCVLTLCLIVGGVFSAAALLIPAQLIGLYSTDAVVISLGAQYLRTLAPAMFCNCVVLCYSILLRSCGDAFWPMLCTGAGVLINASLNYGLIFGKLGLPALGVTGAAIATDIAVRNVRTVIPSCSAGKIAPGRLKGYRH